MGGGGGSDNSMMMMMMAIQQQQQMEQQRREAAQQAFEASQRGENQNYQRYQDLITSSNKKVGDQWNLYNDNIGKIKKINPNYNAHTEFAFNPYQTNSAYRKSTDKATADSNQDLLNNWYGSLDKQSLDDYNMAKSQYDQSKNWLSDTEAQQNALTTKLPGVLPGSWGAGGGNVSGEAGADAQNKDTTAAADGAGMNVGADGNAFAGFGGTGAPAAQTAGTGFIQDNARSSPQNSLASVFSNATGGAKKTSGAFF
jgi:hypothetical protein